MLSLELSIHDTIVVYIVENQCMSGRDYTMTAVAVTAL